MAFFLDHLPPHVHVVITTRADPDLPLSRWRVRGELAEVRAADLRFTPAEADAYLNDVSGLELTPEQVAALEHRTEGWIAALQLAALSLRGRADVGGFIARFDGDDRYVVDYLVDEVLSHQPEPVRRFLAQAAILDRLTGPLCDAVTGGDDGGEMLTALDRANLFVVPLDDQREWYRFHHLFADVLRARLLAEQPDLVPLLHERASRWYEQHDLADESVRHALAAGDMDRVVHLMEMEVASVRRDRREATFMGWLKAVPDEFVRRSPVLSVFSAYTHMASGNLDAVEPRLLDAERELARLPTGSAPPWADTDELRTLPATIAVYRASVAQARGDIPATKAQARRALDLARPTDHLARGSAAGFLGLAAWAEGDVTSALETFTQAVASLHAAGAFVDELSSTVVLADLSLTAGRPHTALRLYQRALGAGRGARRRVRPRDGRPARRGQRGRGGGRRARERPPASLHGRGPRRPDVDGRERLPVVRGHGSGRRGRGRARRGDRSPGPGGGAVPPGLLPGRAAHRSDEGQGADQAGSPVGRNRLGRPTAACRRRTRPATSASSTTSRSCACSSRSTASAPAMEDSTWQPACWTGWKPRPFPRAEPGACSRSGCSDRWPTTPRDAARTRWPTWPTLWPRCRSRTATRAFSSTRAAG